LPVTNYKNYEVSLFGNVRNIKTGRVLKASSKGGYCYVGLSNVNTKSYSVHRLVAQEFIINEENKEQVNHKDKNGLNNKITNLEWVTPKENNIHRSNGVKQTTNQNLIIYRIHPNTDEKLEKFNSIQDAAEWVVSQGLSNKIENVRSSISCAVNKVYKSSFGLKWEKEEQESLEKEEWREIKINNDVKEGYYISSLERFKNKKGIIMSNYKPHHSGYIYVRVNIQKYAQHRLVALMFLSNVENKPFVNHIDGNKTNNKVDNLEWVTCSENNSHNYKIGLTKGHKRKITQYDLEMNEIKKFDSIKSASEILNICCSSIKAVLYNKQKTAGGFIFKYLE